MAKNSLKIISEFLEPKKFAFIGLSRDPKKFSRNIYKELLAKRYEMYPVNPNMDDVEGVKCFHEISDLPQNVKHGFFITPKSSTAEAVKDAIRHGFTHLWIQQGAETKEIIEIAEKNDVKLVYAACIMMHTNPESIHKFHRFMSKLFGAFPKN